MRIFILFALLFTLLGSANAQTGIATGTATSYTVKVAGKTVDVFRAEGGQAGPTILYIPGCNGLDKFGIQYQKYHVERFKKTWPEANIVITQYVNDATKGAVNGKCDWGVQKTNEAGLSSFTQADYLIVLAEWIKSQPWSNREIHLFGFSWGGRVGLWLPAGQRGKQGVFNTVALIWPDCRKELQFFAGVLHTPTKIWATEEDPLSMPKNCVNFFANTNLLNVKLWPGNTHSWLTGPFFKPYDRWWPVQKVAVRHEFNEAWTNETFADWKSWATKYR